MHRLPKILIIGVLVVLLGGILFPFVIKSRTNSDRVGCQDHLRSLGLFGVRHASLPGQPMNDKLLEELPAGTVPNDKLTVTNRLSWYVYTLNVLEQGQPQLDEKMKRRPRGLAEALKGFQPTNGWSEGSNNELAKFRLTTGICPARVPDKGPDDYGTNNYLAVGGLGLETPQLSLLEAGPNAGAYRYNGTTSNDAIVDGLGQTIHLIETSANIGPWLQGGSPTLRGLDVADLPYFGFERPFGGCHPGGTYASMADGSVRFLKTTMNPAIFRAQLTIVGRESLADFE